MAIAHSRLAHPCILVMEAIKDVILSVTDLSLSYERKRVLSNVFLNIELGQLYGLVGPNGAGKSSLFKCILGLVKPNSGKVQLYGGEVKKQRKRLVYVPQKSDVDWTFPATVFDVVAMGRFPFKRLFQRINAEDKAKAMDACQKLGIEELVDRQIGELSGGQQQRVFLARAICQDAEIFFLDEPFVGVDMITEETIIHLLQELRSAGKTILVIHHDLSTVPKYFDQVILLNQRLIAYGSVEDTFTEENVKRTYQAQLPILQKISE